MKNLVHKYRISKFKCFTSGLLFALITIVALAVCFAEIINSTTIHQGIILPFGISVVSMLLGIITMLRNTNEKYKIQN